MKQHHPHRRLAPLAIACALALGAVTGAPGVARGDEPPRVADVESSDPVPIDRKTTDKDKDAPDPRNTPKELQHVGVDEHLDGQLPLDARFLDHTGAAVTLGDFFTTGKPVVLILAYHSCPVLCSMVQSGAATAMKSIPWTVGKEYEVVVLSIDPRDTPERAAEKRAAMIANYGRTAPGGVAGQGFHFLVGSKSEIDRVATAAGFQYEYDASQGQYAHPAVVMLAKPNGQLARYLYGLEYEPNDLRIGLLEASNGHSISTVEKVLLYCYHYDPKGGKYVLMATRVMRLGGALTVVILGGFLAAMWGRERRRARELKISSQAAPTPSASHS